MKHAQESRSYRCSRAHRPPAPTTLVPRSPGTSVTIAARRAPSTNSTSGKVFVEHWRTRCRRGPSGIECERRAIEYHLVLTGPPDARTAVASPTDRARCSHSIFTLDDLAEMERRRIDRHTVLARPPLSRAHPVRRTTRPRRSPRRISRPCTSMTTSAGKSAVATRCEIAPLIEHLVIGQLPLAIRRGDAAASPEHRRGVVTLRHRN